ncbi:MAG: MotA/TolQ/ExbB proton channel family protein [Planctomycetes bacterium]|nr:MotA/TolQ/ExbB proton channel family protein [Planctomycetota bacterium]
MTLLRLFGFVTLTALVLSTIAASPGAAFFAFVDYPSLMLVVGGTFAVLMIACDVDDWRNARRVVIGPRKALDRGGYRSAARFFGQASRAAIAMGVIGHLIGLIIMLGQFNDPNALGPGMAVSLISALYGLGLSEFFFVPMQTTALKRAESDEQPGVGRATPLVLMLFVIFSVGLFCVLLVSMM